MGTTPLHRFLKQLQAAFSQVPSAPGEAIFPFTRSYTLGIPPDRQPSERPTVRFRDPRGCFKTIVNCRGRILNFPGIQKGDWTAQLNDPASLLPIVRFRTDFDCWEDRYIMIWQVQPDGRYWEDDDGFGITSEMEIRLYALLDRWGRFTGPFRIYNLGDNQFPVTR